MTHPTITTYNSNYSQLTKTERVTFVGGGVLSDNQGGTLNNTNYNNGRDTETGGFGEDCHVCTNTNITI